MTGPSPQVVLRPLASPLPLGLLALAVGSFTVAGLQLSWVPAAGQHMVGMVLLAFVVPLQLLSNGLACAVMAMTAARFLVTGVYELSGSRDWMTAAGVMGVALAAVALYAALAFDLEDASGRTVLPTLRRGATHPALSRGKPGELEKEAGVRRTL